MLDKSLFTTSVSSLGIDVSVEEPISLDSNPIVPKPNIAKKVEWDLNNVLRYLGRKIAMGKSSDGC